MRRTKWLGFFICLFFNTFWNPSLVFLEQIDQILYLFFCVRPQSHSHHGFRSLHRRIPCLICPQPSSCYLTEPITFKAIERCKIQSKTSINSTCIRSIFESKSTSFLTSSRIRHSQKSTLSQLFYHSTFISSRTKRWIRST